MKQPAMILLALVSFVLDHREKEKAHKSGHTHFKTPRENNFFTFYPMIEVAVLFIGIFITMIPAICLLKAHGAETGVTHAWQFFWMSGLSSFWIMPPRPTLPWVRGLPKVFWPPAGVFR
jgi:hypothetical protein